MPKISIITAAYNHVRFVRQSVESAQAQTYRDFEHIVVDDGSTDGTAEILQEYGNRIKYIRQENRGTHASFNVAIRASSGEYIAILDSDDAWLPNKLERQMKAFEEFPDAGVVYSLAYTIDENGNIRNNGETYGKPFQDSQHAYRELVRINYVPVLTALVRRDRMYEVGLFDETLKAISDWDLWLRISACAPIFCVPEPLALYRVHDKNTLNILLQSGRFHEDWLRMLEKFENEHPGLIPEIASIKAEVANAYATMALDTAYHRFYRHQYPEAKRYLKMMFMARPTWIKNGRFVRLATKLMLGERGTKMVVKIKRSVSHRG